MTKITNTGTNPPSRFNEKVIALLKGVKQESDKRLREDVRRVLVDSKDMETLFNSYIRNVIAWEKKGKADEALMESIENKLGVTDASRTEYRYWIIEQMYIALETDQELSRALEDVLIERYSDITIPLPNEMTLLVEEKKE